MSVRELPRGASVLVMGLGSFGGGVGVVRHLAALGCRVRVTDLRPEAELEESLGALDGLPLELTLGGHRDVDFSRAEVVVVNPAVPPSSPFLATARRAGARITSEIELFLEHVPGRVVAVTGTQGKSSTCAMAADFLRASGFRTHLGGNIGGSLLGSLATIRPDDVVVLELSSYQLEGLSAPRELPARFAALAISNVLADHLERHGTVEAYRAAKLRLLELARGETITILPGADPHLAGIVPPRGTRWSFWPEGAGGSGLILRDGLFQLDDEVLGRVRDLRLPGAFQRENALIALGLARAVGASPDSLAGAVGTARGLEHRLQDLGLRRGRWVIDNAVSTTPDSTVAALRSVTEGCTLICGGRAKGLPLDGLAREAAERARHVVTFGESAGTLAGAFERAEVPTSQRDSLEAAVADAFEASGEGDTLLFSPACASFDAYPNFLRRARAFRAALPPLDRG